MKKVLELWNPLGPLQFPPPRKSQSFSVEFPRNHQHFLVGKDLSEWTCKFILSQAKRRQVALVVDRGLRSWASTWHDEFLRSLDPALVLEVELSHKDHTLEEVRHLIARFERAQLNRTAVVVVMGGGSLGDVGGLAASIYMRGIDWVFIPTTLMSQADSVVQKVAVDDLGRKSLLGAFFSPVLTICDVDILRELQSGMIDYGMSEVIKHTLLGNEDEFQQLVSLLERGHQNWDSGTWADVIVLSLSRKCELVGRDPFDQNGYHRALALGHTLAVAIEEASDFRVHHGLGVGLGLRFAARVSRSCGLLSSDTASRVEGALDLAQAPRIVPQGVSVKRLRDRLGRTKISGDGSISMLLLEDIGKWRYERLVSRGIAERSLATILS